MCQVHPLSTTKPTLRSPQGSRLLRRGEFWRALEANMTRAFIAMEGDKMRAHRASQASVKSGWRRAQDVNHFVIRPFLPFNGTSHQRVTSSRYGNDGARRGGHHAVGKRVQVYVRGMCHEGRIHWLG
eukprot:6212638-Pleurochrysis_carterae.AAC.2